jgi:hypothetical protein
MKPFLSALLLFFFSSLQVIYGQSPSIDKVQFFTDTSMFSATITTNMSKLFSQKNKSGYTFPATFSATLANGVNVNDQIELELRGHFRKGYCYMPPIKIIFKNNKSSVMQSLKSLKLVNECKFSGQYEQYLLKEFTVYKIFNLLTDLSFRVRLLNLNFQDSSGRKKPITEHAFLMEDIKELAKRNNCTVWANGHVNTEASQRRQMTMVAVFEYMIGNTDWAVSVEHNIKLVVSKKDSSARPYAVPYDFDYSGLVNTEYAVPDERLELENVRERLYRGYPRTMPELNEVLDIFKQQKEKIYALINNFNLLTSRSKDEMTGYLDAFYKTINSPADVKSVFIENARNQ